jgi:hypothetical protein
MIVVIEPGEDVLAFMTRELPGRPELQRAYKQFAKDCELLAR